MEKAKIHILDDKGKKREDKTEEDVKFVINLMKERGSVEYAEKKAEEYAKEALEKFKEHFSDLPNKEAFEAAIEFFTLKRDV